MQTTVLCSIIYDLLDLFDRLQVIEYVLKGKNRRLRLYKIFEIKQLRFLITFYIRELTTEILKEPQMLKF